MSLVALLVLLTLHGASSIDVPVEIGFEFSGLHSDFAQQFYVLYTELDDTAQLSDVSSSALPSDLKQQLSTNSLSWGDLPVAYTQCPLTPAMVIPSDHKQDKTWLLVPLCIVTFVTFGTVAVYRKKSLTKLKNTEGESTAAHLVVFVIQY
eukprot:jgi/Phyca11/532242/estExt2_fgenesh1_pg.C_PHYCAscaffold_40205